MKLSRKPRNLVIVMLMAVMLLTFAGIAAAAPAVNWTFSANQLIASVGGSVYENTYQHVYATVYANVYGQLVPTGIVNQDIYSSKPFQVSLAQRGLISGQQYWVSLKVYDLTNAQVIDLPQINFRYYADDNSYIPSGGGGGGAVIPTTPATTLPAINAIIGTPVSITAASGGTISATGVTITIPAGALAADVKVTISKVADTAGLKVDANSKIISDVLEIIKDKTGDFSKPITITLNFDKSKVDLDKFDVKVCFFDEKAGKWVALDNISVGDGKVSGDVTHFTKFAVLTFPKEAAKPAAGTLSDIVGHWAEANIKKLVDAKAIAGYPDGTFKPNNTITRAEFATVLVKALNIAPSSDKVFADTASHWPKTAFPPQPLQE